MRIYTRNYASDSFVSSVAFENLGVVRRWVAVSDSGGTERGQHRKQECTRSHAEHVHPVGLEHVEDYVATEECQNDELSGGLYGAFKRSTPEDKSEQCIAFQIRRKSFHR